MKKIASCALFALLVFSKAPAQTPAATDFLKETPAEKNARMAWWREAKFGLFLHWGIYAVAGGEWFGAKNYGEWLMEEANIPKAEYEKLAGRFNPEKFDAEAWVQMAKYAGMKYIVITSKHHDGFCMFDSKVSDYDIADRTPFRRDVLRELADACRKHGIKLCFYHSIMDWHHPDAEKENFARYREKYLKPQLRELLTNYGDIGVLWFDGEWIDEWTEEQGRDLYNFVRNIKPDLIVNNRVGKGRNGMQGMNKTAEAVGDFGTPEQEILGTKSDLDWESCMTMNGHWGWNKHDKNFKTAEDLVWNLVDVVAKGGNYLLNVGPTDLGLFPDESVSALRKMGDWMKANGSAIYAARAWAHTNEDDNIRYAVGREGAVFAFVRHFSGQKLTLRKIELAAGSSVQVLGSPQPLTWQKTAEGTEINLPENVAAAVPGVPILVLKMQGNPTEVCAAPLIGTGQSVVVFAGATQVEMRAGEPGSVVRYTLDGSAPTSKSKIYKKPFGLKKNTRVSAAAFRAGKASSDRVSAEFVRAEFGATLSTDPAPQYAAAGPLSLVDGRRGTTDFHRGNWLGFEGKDFAATLDFGKKRAVKTIKATFLQRIGAWIFLPIGVEIQTSNDGKTFEPLTRKGYSPPDSDTGDRVKDFSFDINAECRYLRIVVKSLEKCPWWHAGNGGKAWTFLDEIEVR